jgi:hypothetical protein
MDYGDGLKMEMIGVTGNREEIEKKIQAFMKSAEKLRKHLEERMTEILGGAFDMEVNYEVRLLKEEGGNITWWYFGHHRPKEEVE